MMHDVPDSVKHIWALWPNLYAFTMRVDSY
jgi:hypothetical protein